MMNQALRIVAILFTVLVAVIGNARLELGETNIPITADSAFELRTSENSPTKAEIAKVISDMADEGSLAVAQVSLTADRFSAERVLRTFGKQQIPVDAQHIWALPERNGGVQPYVSADGYKVDGYYVVWGGNIVEQLKAWGAQNNVLVSDFAVPSASDMTNMALFVGTSYPPLLALFLALLVLLVVNSTRQVRANTQKYLNGISPLRLGVENAARTLITVLLPMAGVAAIATVIVSIRSGSAFVPKYLVGLAQLLLPAIIILCGCACIFAILTRPTLAVIAKREYNSVRLGRVGEGVKLVALATAFLLLPVAVTGLLRADQFRAEAEVWKKFAGVVSVNNFGGEPGSAEEAETDAKFAEIVANNPGVMLVYDFGYTMQLSSAELGNQFDGLVIVNSAYLKRVGIAAADSESAEITPALAAALAPSLQLQLRDRETPEAEIFNTLAPQQLRAGFTLPVITGRYLEEMVLMHRPLLLVVDDLSALSPTFLGAATSNSGVLFPDAKEFEKLLRQYGLYGDARSAEYVATAGLLALQSRQATAMYAAIAVVILLCTLVICLWTSSRQYVLSRAKRFLPLALSGHSAMRAMRRRLSWELGSIIVIWLLAMLVAAVSGAELPAYVVLLAAAAGALALSLLFHSVAYDSVVRRTLLRKPI